MEEENEVNVEVTMETVAKTHMKVSITTVQE